MIVAASDLAACSCGFLDNQSSLICLLQMWLLIHRDFTENGSLSFITFNLFHWLDSEQALLSLTRTAAFWKRLNYYSLHMLCMGCATIQCVYSPSLFPFAA